MLYIFTMSSVEKKSFKNEDTFIMFVSYILSAKV